MTVLLKNARVRTPSAFLFAVVLAWTGLGFLPAVFATVGLLPWSDWSIWQAIPGLAYLGGMLGLALLWQRRWHRITGELRADETGLFVAGARVVARQRLLHGYVHIEGGRTYLRLVRRAFSPRPIDIEVADEAQANELLTALRLDAKSSVGEYKLMNGHRRRFAARSLITAGTIVVVCMSMLLSFGMRSALLQVVGVAMFFATALGAALAALSQAVRVSVGADGIFVHQRFMTRRFVSFADVRDVKQEGTDLTITLADHTTIELHHPDALVENEKDNAKLVDRIHTALASYRAAPPVLGAFVAHDGRSIEAWIAAAKAKNEKNASYRSAALPEEQLWRIVEDPSASPTERADAALALRGELNDAGRTRLRIAAGACASTQLRVALETAAADDDEALASALEPLRARSSR